MRFENQINDSIDRRNPGEHPVIVEMHPKAVEMLNDGAIDSKHFYEHFGQKAVAQNIKWTTLLRLASVVQREANGKEDMPLIAGILWNRLLKDMRLEVDATLQYARSNTGDGWWAPITIAKKQIDSPYNTYKNTGLPPHHISNPCIEAIEAALHPASTTCLYYLHDSSREIHCSDTYNGHK